MNVSIPSCKRLQELTIGGESFFEVIHESSCSQIKTLKRRADESMNVAMSAMTALGETQIHCKRG